MKELKLLYCEHCKKIVEVVNDTAVPVMCCGQKMTEIKANSTEAAVEKHLPVINADGQKVTVTVSTVEHPMIDTHIILQTYGLKQTKLCTKNPLFQTKNLKLYFM